MKDFKIEKRIVRVPTEFVVVDGQRMRWDDFDLMVNALKELAGKPLERRDLYSKISVRLNPEVVKAWEKSGLVRTFNEDWDNDGRTVTSEMIGRGPAYGKFMAKIKVFEGQVRAERASAAKEARRTRLQAELASLDKPARPRKGVIKNPYYGAVFEV